MIKSYDKAFIVAVVGSLTSAVLGGVIDAALSAVGEACFKGVGGKKQRMILKFLNLE